MTTKKRGRKTKHRSSDIISDDLISVLTGVEERNPKTRLRLGHMVLTFSVVFYRLYGIVRG